MRPLIKPGTHPLERMEYLIPTPAVNGFSDFVQSSLKINMGGIVPGSPRMGKSTAIKYLKAELLNMPDNKYPVFVVEAEDRRTPSRKAFFGSFLTDVGHSIVSCDAEARKNRLMKFIITESEKTNTNKIILFVDESQNWQEVELKWLVEIWNALDRRQIHLITFLVGELDLLYKRNMFKGIGAMKVVNRFMSRTYEFHGLEDVADIEHVLECYDYESEFPVGSGYSFSRFFCEEAFDSGWRLKNEAQKIWNSFKEVRERNKIDVLNEVPMVFMARTVEHLLLRTKLDKCSYSYKDINTAVEESGYVEGSSYIIKPKNPEE